MTPGMQHISKKLIRLVIMDALDEVLKEKPETRLSRPTQMIIIEASEKIAEAVQADVQADRKPLTLNARQKKRNVTTSDGKRISKTSLKKKTNKRTA